MLFTPEKPEGLKKLEKRFAELEEQLKATSYKEERGRLIRDALVDLHGEQGGEVYDEYVEKHNELKRRVNAGEDWKKVYDELWGLAKEVE